MKYTRNRYGINPYPMDWELAVLWGMYQRWSLERSSRDIKKSKRTVSRIKRKLTDDPSTIFRCPVLVPIVRRRDLPWQCEFCGGESLVGEREAHEHVTRLVLPEEVVRERRVMPPFVA